MEKLLEKFNNKKSIENLVIFLVLCIIVMIVINALTDEKESVLNNTESSIIFTNTASEKTLETKLAEILSMINGAGKVDVMISYVNEVEKIIDVPAMIIDDRYESYDYCCERKG